MLICAGLYLLACAIPAAVAQDRTDEVHLLKAAFIFNFARFTRWPETREGEDAPLILCTAGDDGLVGELGRLGGRTVRGRRVSILPLENVPVPKSCHVLYVAVSKQEGYVDILESVRHAPVLTVSEIPRFERRGGIIELFHEQERIRFIINQGAARRAGLKLNSRLLNLAIVVDH